MPRIFDKRNSYGMMSEQDDIDSDFPQSDDNSMISIEVDDDDESYMEETYYSSDNNSRRIETQVYDRTLSSDEDSIEYYESESHTTEDDIFPNKSYEDSVTSPTSVSEDHLDRRDESSRSKKSKKSRDDSSKSKKSKKNKDKKDKKKNKKSPKKEKKGFFLNKLINSKILTSLKEVTNSGRKTIDSKKRNSDLSDGDIERSESGYGTSGKGSYPQDESMDSYYDVHSEGSHSRSMSHSYSMSTQSYSRSHEPSESETSTSQNSSIFVSPQPRRSLNEDRRKAYEQALPDVAEELEEEMDNTEEFAPEYRTYKVRMQKGIDPAMHSYESYKKKSSPDSKESKRDPKGSNKRDAPVREPPDAPEETPDPISPAPSKKSTTSSKKSKAISHSPKSTKTSKSKKKKKKKDKSQHSSALSGRTHSVSSRINYAGQICSSPAQTKTKELKKEKETNEDLQAEVHRLKTLVELMMTRMELYERQSECLVETSLEHDREWKKTTIEHFEAAQQRKALTESGKQLLDIKNLLTERSIQDKWIRQLESVQRGYQNRLATTQNQLRALRYEHVLTNKQIVDYKKKGGDLANSNHTPDTLLEDLTTSTRMQEATTPVMANLNVVPLPKWVDPTTSGRDASGKKVLLDGTSMTTLATSQGMEPRGRKNTTSLLEEMIVSWHNDDTDISVLSEKGRNKDKRKMAKKAKKERKKLEKMKLQQRRDSNSSAPEIDGKGGFVTVEA